MKRRTYVFSVGAGATALAGGVVLGRSSSSPRATPEDRRIVYEREGLELRALQNRVHLGETIGFEITNTSDSSTVLGCHDPWKIQAHTDEQWEDVTGTPSGYYDMCAFELAPGATDTKRIRLSAEELDARTDLVERELHPGQYRFVLLGTSPFLAVDFRALSSR